MKINGNLTFAVLGSGQLENAIIERLSGAPTGVAGRIYYDTGTNFYYYYNGTTWQQFSAGSSSVSSFQTSLSGLSPSTPTTGTVTLSGTLGIASGGTGQTTASAAFGALSPLTTNGDILYYDGGNTRLPIGSTNQALVVVAGEPAWTAIVNSIAGTANEITASASTGAVTLSLSSTLVAPGSVTVTGLFYESAETLTAVGIVQGGAPITDNYVVASTNTSANTAVTLPASAAGLEVSIVNLGPLTLLVFPASGDAIDGAGVDTAVTIPLGGTATYQSVNVGQWYTIDPVAVSGGTGLTVTYGNGQTIFSNTGVTSISGTTNQVTVTPSTGAVTVSTPSTFVAPGSITATTTLTVSGNSDSAFLYSNATDQVVSTNAGDTLVNGNLLIGGSTGPVASTLTAGTGITITNGIGSITVSQSAGSNVTSFQTSLSGLTPATATTGAITLAGTLGATSGGTGQSTYAVGDILYASSTTVLSRLAIGTATQVLHGGTTPSYSAVVLTTDVTGVLPLANGGTNSSTLGTAGAVIYDTGTALADSSGTAGYALTSGGASAPVWQAVTSTLTTSQILEGNGSGAFTANGATFVGSGSFSGVTLSGTVTSPTDATTKAYVDNAIAGLEWKDAAQAATTANIPNVAYANGTAGVGATLTDTTTGTVLVVDGYTVNLNDRVLVKNQSAGLQNGIYSLTTVGVTGTTPFVLTRVTDADTSSTLNNATLYVTDGSTNSNTGWTQTADNATIGTTPITFVQFSGSGTYTANTTTGLALTGNVFSINQGAGITTNPATQLGVNLYTGNTSTAGGLITTSDGSTFDDTHAGALYLLLANIGAIATFGAITGGSSYTNGSYPNTPLTGGFGAGATANITVAGNTVTVVTLVNPGSEYKVGDVLSATIPGGAGFSIPVATITVNPGLTQDTNGLYVPQGAITNPMLENPSVTIDVTGGGTGAMTLGTTLSILGDATRGLSTTLSGGTVNGGYNLTPPMVTVTAAYAGNTNANVGVSWFDPTYFQANFDSAGEVTWQPTATLTVASLTDSGLNANAFLFSGTGGLLTSTASNPANGALLIGAGTSAPVAATLTAGSGITITNAAGSITIAQTGGSNVTSITGTTNEIAANGVFTAQTGAVTLTIPTTFVAPGSVQVTTYLYESVTPNVTAAGSTQGTATALTSMFNTVTTVATNTGVSLPTAVAGLEISIVNFGANPLNVYPATGGAIDGAGTNNPIVIPNGGTWTGQADSTTQWYSIDPVTVAGTGVSVAYGNGQTTISNTGVTSFSAGTTGLTPATATTGAVTLAGTLIAANGGTGFASYTAGDILYANSTTTLAKLPAGTANQVLHSGTTPTWSAVSLTADVSGTLPVANGGTNNTSAGSAGNVLVSNGTTTFAPQPIEFVYETSLHGGPLKAYKITHNLDQQYVNVTVFDTTTPATYTVATTTAGSSGTGMFVVNGVDLTAIFVTGFQFVILGSTGGVNDQTFTVVSSSFSTNTTITVQETVTSAVTGGTIYVGPNQVIPQQVMQVDANNLIVSFNTTFNAYIVISGVTGVSPA